jgi:hypothetical protein
MRLQKDLDDTKDILVNNFYKKKQTFYNKYLFLEKYFG